MPRKTSPEEHLEEVLQDFWSGDPVALQQLRLCLAGGLHFYLKRNLGVRNAPDRVEELLDAGIAALRSGQVRSAAELTGFLRIAARAKVEEATTKWKRAIPADENQVRTMKQALSEFPQRDREAATRYSDGQHPEMICAELALSLAQFSALQARLKARFAELSFSTHKN